MKYGGESTAWIETVTLSGSNEPVRVVFDGRAGTTVFVRQVDPGEPVPERVPIEPGDELVMMVAISHLGLHATSGETAVNDLLLGMRVLPLRREGRVVFARTLRFGEIDTGQRVHVRPGEQIQFEEGSLVLELDYIDSLEPPTASGYVPLTPVLASWWGFSRPSDESKVRYVLAAARRLDIASQLLGALKAAEEALSETTPLAEAKRQVFAVIGAIEVAVGAFGRAMSMVADAPDSIRGSVPVPANIAAAIPAITEIRNAYEHIEDRAFGSVWGKPHPDALDIFDHTELLQTDTIVYGASRLDLSAEVPELMAAAREFLKSVAKN